MLNRIRNAFRNPNSRYAGVKLSSADIAKGTYKRFFGGGSEKWEKRGKFQLFFLQNQALAPHHRLLDVGCGPLRAGEHLIDYLDASNYCGVDYNADFIRTAKELVAQNPALERKKPSLLQLDNFNFSQLRGPFDYVLAFSVLNHCDAESKARFFRELPQVLKETSRVYLTHAAWFDSSMLAGSTLKLVTKLAGPGDVSPGLDMAAWGWPPTESIYPILQLGLSNP